jgi:hypothetical protein
MAIATRSIMSGAHDRFPRAFTRGRGRDIHGLGRIHDDQWPRCLLLILLRSAVDADEFTHKESCAPAGEEPHPMKLKSLPNRPCEVR